MAIEVVPVGVLHNCFKILQTQLYIDSITSLKTSPWRAKMYFVCIFSNSHIERMSSCIDVIMMTSRSLLCGIKCTVAMVQVHLSDAYGRLLQTGAVCDGWIRLEDSDDQKCGPNIYTICGNQ